MIPAIELRVIELLAARLCHDLIGPVSAIGNGVELLADDDPEFAKEAALLIADAVKKASRRLQFHRFALGHSGGGLRQAMNNHRCSILPSRNHATRWQASPLRRQE